MHLLLKEGERWNTFWSSDDVCLSTPAFINPDESQILPCVSPEFPPGAKHPLGIAAPTIKTFKYFCLMLFWPQRSCSVWNTWVKRLDVPEVWPSFTDGLPWQCLIPLWKTFKSVFSSKSSAKTVSPASWTSRLHEEESGQWPWLQWWRADHTASKPTR